jgi:hypothetical protein
MIDEVKLECLNTSERTKRTIYISSPYIQSRDHKHQPSNRRTDTSERTPNLPTMWRAAYTRWNGQYPGRVVSNSHHFLSHTLSMYRQACSNSMGRIAPPPHVQLCRRVQGREEEPQQCISNSKSRSAWLTPSTERWGESSACATGLPAARQSLSGQGPPT